MGLPKPLGPYAVAFTDFELRKTEGDHGATANVHSPHQHQQGSPDFVTLADAHGAPLIRIFYPTLKAQSYTPLSCSARWLPSIMYTWGFVSKLIPPSSSMRRFAIWILAGIVHSLLWPGAVIHASVGSPLLSSDDDDKERRFPVVVFSHGLWACRTTYSAFCSDLASHGYVVAALEHVDGSASMASYVDQNGERKWLHNTFAHLPAKQIKMQDRTKQLKQRVVEVCKVLDVLESLDKGLLTQNANVIGEKVGLNVSMLQGRLDLNLAAVSGHSFGGATAVVAAGCDERFKCCLAMDAWWEPIDKIDFEKLAGHLPILLLNTESFEWKTLHELRMKFMNARAKATDHHGRPLVTELKTIKGTSHQDQSDVTMLLPNMMKKLGVAGKLDPFVTREVNSRASLEFLHKHLLPPGTGHPFAVDVGTDPEHLIIYDQSAS